MAHDMTLPDGAAGVFRIWPGDGPPPGSETWDWTERTAPVPSGPPGQTYVRNVVVPTVTLFQPPQGRANGTALVIAPGGAFHFLMMEHEGFALARGSRRSASRASCSSTASPERPTTTPRWRSFAPRSDCGSSAPARPRSTRRNANSSGHARLLAEEDGRQAIRFVRQQAAGWGIDPGRIGIAGFSAGGGVAMGAAFEHDAESRPDFVAALYPAYRGGLPVPVNAPPLFLVIADDDGSIAPISSARLYEAWHKAGVPAELHVFGEGGHGFGMNQSARLSDAWTGLFDSWLGQRGLLAGR